MEAEKAAAASGGYLSAIEVKLPAVVVQEDYPAKDGYSSHSGDFEMKVSVDGGVHNVAYDSLDNDSLTAF